MLLTGSLWIIWMIFTLVHLVVWILFLALYYTRRAYQPLKSSRPNVIFMANIGGVVFSLVVLLGPLIGASMNAFAALMIAGTSLGVMVDAYMVLSSWLYIAFNRTQMQLEIQASMKNRNRSLVKGIANIRKYGFLLTDRFARILVTVNAVVYNIAILAYAIVGYQEVFTTPFNVAFYESKFFNMQGISGGRVFVTSILLCVIAFRIRLIKDETGIKRLLKRTALVAIFFILIFYVVMAIEIVLAVKTKFEMIFALLGADGTFYVSIVVPVRRSFRLRAGITDECVIDSIFTGFLKTDIGYQAFKHHLEKEFSVENILFWHDAELFKNEFATNENNFERAVKIFELYLEKNSPLAVNLDSDSLRYYRNVFSRSDGRINSMFQKFKRRLSITTPTKLSVQPAVVVPGEGPSTCGRHDSMISFLQPDLFGRASKQLLKLMESDSVTGLQEMAVHDLVHITSESDFAARLT